TGKSSSGTEKSSSRVGKRSWRTRKQSSVFVRNRGGTEKNRLVSAKDRLVPGKDRLVPGKDRLVLGRDRLVSGKNDRHATYRGSKLLTRHARFPATSRRRRAPNGRSPAARPMLSRAPRLISQLTTRSKADSHALQ